MSETQQYIDSLTRGKLREMIRKVMESDPEYGPNSRHPNAKLAEGRCTVSVFGDWHRHQCQRKSKFTFLGRHYCAQHRPKNIVRKNIKRTIKWKQDWDKRNHGRRVSDLAREIVSTSCKCFRQEASFDDLEKLCLEYERLKGETPDGRSE